MALNFLIFSITDKTIKLWIEFASLISSLTRGTTDALQVILDTANVSTIWILSYKDRPFHFHILIDFFMFFEVCLKFQGISLFHIIAKVHSKNFKVCANQLTLCFYWPLLKKFNSKSSNTIEPLQQRSVKQLQLNAVTEVRIKMIIATYSK